MREIIVITKRKYGNDKNNERIEINKYFYLTSVNKHTMKCMLRIFVKFTPIKWCYLYTIICLVFQHIYI